MHSLIFWANDHWLILSDHTLQSALLMVSLMEPSPYFTVVSTRAAEVVRTHLAARVSCLNHRSCFHCIVYGASGFADFCCLPSGLNKASSWVTAVLLCFVSGIALVRQT